MIQAQDYRAKLLEYGRFDHVAISPSEDLFFGIEEGNIYKANGLKELWHSVKIKQAPVSDYRQGDFRKIYFLTDNIVIAFAQEYHQEKSFFGTTGKRISYLYKSSDRGESWKKIELGEWDYIHNIFIDKKKRIWASASHTDRYCSEDMGDTWEKIQFPSTFKAQRITFSESPDGKSIFLTDDKCKIYKTTNEFLLFDSISSPITRTKETEYIRPVHKFEQLGDYYIACQEDKVFYTNINNINWINIEGAKEFILSNQLEAYILNKDFSISLIDSSMKIKWTSEEKPKYYSDLYTVNNNLYYFTNRDFYKINKNSFEKLPLYTDEHPIEPTYRSIEWKGEKICFDDEDVLRFDNQKKLWYRYMVLPVDFSYASIYKNQIILADYELESYYTLDLEDKSYKDFTLPEHFVNTENIEIESFRIEKGSEGCFHSWVELENYEYADGYFIKQPLKTDSFERRPPKSLQLKDKKDSGLIQVLLQEINTTEQKKLSLSGLQIMKSDIENYKKFLRLKKGEYKEYLNEIEITSNDTSLELSDLIVPEDDSSEDYYLYIPENITAYEKYEILADSVFSVSDDIINEIFTSSSGISSTTTDWIKLSILFSDSTIISVYSDDKYPNYLHTPWTIDYDGLKVKTNSFTIGLLLNEIGENKLMIPIISDKRYAIHQIVDYLYKKRKKEGTLDKLVYSPVPIETKSYSYTPIIITASTFIIFMAILIFTRKTESKIS